MPSFEIDPATWPQPSRTRAPDPAIEARIAALLEAMSLEEKVGQIIQADLSSVTPQDVRAYRLGSILCGGNTGVGGDLRAAPATWLETADAFWDASMDGGAIPILWGVDAVHGLAKVVGATVFPHNVGLGASRDLDLIERIGAATALEMRVCGLDWTFAPAVSVPQDLRWGRTYEGYGEAPALVGACAAALIRGLQGGPDANAFGPGKVLATAKHFLGDGGTEDGRDQGETRADEAEMIATHAAPYLDALDAGALCVMASFSSWRGKRMHGDRELLTGVLKERWGFEGLVIGDWNGHRQAPGATSEYAPGALTAGLDVYMAPDTWRSLYRATLEGVRRGEIALERLDDAVTRVLRVKLRVGLFEAPKPSARPFAGAFELLSCKAHRELAAEAAAKSAVLLKNDRRLLPIAPNARVLVAGDGAASLQRACGGWTLNWQGNDARAEDFPQAETFEAGLRRRFPDVVLSPDGAFETPPDVAVVAFGEAPYAEFRGDLDALDYKPGDATDLALLRRLKAAGIPVVSVFFSGRPLWINPLINASDAVAAAFLPGAHAGAIADLLVAHEGAAAERDFSARLPFTWPRDADHGALSIRKAHALFPAGYGLSVADERSVPQLHEDGSVTQANWHLVFARGAAQGGWRLALGGVAARGVDLGRQEGALLLEWSGAANARAAFERAVPCDASREANADFELRLEFVLRGEAPSRFTLCLESGAGRARLDLTAHLAASANGAATIDVPLKSLARAGADLHGVSALALECDEAFAVILTSIEMRPSAIANATAEA